MESALRVTRDNLLSNSWRSYFEVKWTQYPIYKNAVLYSAGISHWKNFCNCDKPNLLPSHTPSTLIPMVGWVPKFGRKLQFSSKYQINLSVLWFVLCLLCSHTYREREGHKCNRCTFKTQLYLKPVYSSKSPSWTFWRLQILYIFCVNTKEITV